MANVTKLTDAAGQLRSKRSFKELKDQKSEYVTLCDEQLCEQESSQARQMDRGEIEVEERKR